MAAALPLFFLAFIPFRSHTYAARPVPAKAELHKLSPMVRRLCADSGKKRSLAPGKRPAAARRLCAFVKAGEGGDSVIAGRGGRVLASFGDIHIVSMPVDSIAAISRLPSVQRIEASPSARLSMDSVAVQVGAGKAAVGAGLPSAFTGRGVVVGVEDIGFDLTHPNFHGADGECRIKAFWDQLSPDTIGSGLFVGREYRTADSLLAVGRSYDGLMQTHGTHTLGIAAGGGFGSPYRGVAYESDICIVANAVAEDTALIREEDRHKYTTATDALGFKYIFDYAESVGKPCVVSFSEGSHESFDVEYPLYYAVLDSLTGPGRILVASAGNEGGQGTYFRKPAGRISAGTFISPMDKGACFTFKGSGGYAVRLVAYGESNDTLAVRSADVCSAADSTLSLALGVGIEVEAVAYRSAYGPETCIDFCLGHKDKARAIGKISVEAVGEAADVECFRYGCFFHTSSTNPSLDAAERRSSVYLPGAAPGVVCVGATAMARTLHNWEGEDISPNVERPGLRAEYSSVGPALSGAVKPDVVAPGTGVVSSYSSFYAEKNPGKGDLHYDVERFWHNGRRYSWNSNSGTSMSTPVVAGIVALWLQADPTLTPTGVVDVIKATAAHPDKAMAYPNNHYGHGSIDAYAGLLHILNPAGMPSVPRTHLGGVSVLRTAGGLLLRFASPPQAPLSVSLHSLDGRLLHSGTVPAGAVSYRAEAQQPPGLFIVQVADKVSGRSASTIARLSK